MSRLRSVCVALLVGAAGPVGAGSPSPAAVGERLYLHGIAADGEARPVTVQYDLAARSSDFPCASCHGRSAFGSFEGSMAVPPVTGPALFRPRVQGVPEAGSVRSTGPATRPAYDERSLLRAVRDGIDASGRPLSPSMPRYAVRAADVAALAAYLRTLAASPPPGVTASTAHLSTITSSTLDAATRSTLLAVLRAFVTAKNANTRNEISRRDRGGWDMQAHHDGYRQWVLHEWLLDGSEAGWPDQLNAHYVRQPVFAIVSGAVDGDWSAIHDFCERTRVPCVLPQAELAPVLDASEDFYSIYFSSGVGVEARTLAHHLAAGGAQAARAGVLQVGRCGRAFERISGALQAALRPGTAVAARCLDAATASTAAAWRSALAGGAGVVVAWTGPDDLAGLRALAAQAEGLPAIAALYLSSTLLREDAARDSASLPDRTFLLHPFVLPDVFDRHAARALAWLKARGLRPAKRRVAVDALFAATVAADALTHPGTLSSREYFIERLEHMAGRTPQPSAVPAIALGPRRRVASLGCYVLKVPSRPDGEFTTILDWWVP